ncbi:MAG: helix-turn-helix domain-containing protein [Pseudomonadales bacterium]|nr:helix-turn-helix domain-containing protein [Pseudomonadales bacterium]
MSETVLEKEDGLSQYLRQIRFKARVFFRSEYCGPWAVDTSGDQQVPFHLVCQGEGWLHSDDAEPMRLMAGHLVLFPQDNAHVLASSAVKPAVQKINLPPPDRISGEATRLVCGYFEFDRKTASPFLAGLPATMIVDLGRSERGTLRELVNLWIRESRDEQLGSDFAVDLLAELVFLEMLRSEAQRGQLQGVIGALGDERLGAILTMIHRRPEDPYTAASLAREAGMSESAFAKRFKEKVGVTVGAYLRQWRLQLAARALRESNDSMATIAADVGYESEVAFRKAFSSYFGTAPGRYRRTERP